MKWKALKATWEGITAVMDEYETDSEQWASLVEARRLVEAVMFDIGEPWDRIAELSS